MPEGNGPVCYRDAGIFECLSEVPQERAGAVLRFLRGNNVFEEGQADYATSLVLLHASDGWRIRADLNFSPELKQLPLLKRTGQYTPWMRGHQLGFHQDTVTDADLQRAWCLFLTARAAFEEWIDLLRRIIEALNGMADGDLEQAIDQVKQALDPDSRAKFEPLCQVLRPRTAPAGATSAKLVTQLKALLYGWTGQLLTHVQINEHELEYLGHEIAKLVAPERRRESAQSHSTFLADLVRALFLALRADAFRARHLGRDRLGRISQFDPRNLVIQGAGDLSMNEWNVAFYRTPPGTQPEVFLPESEPYTSRVYNCLMLWRKRLTSTEQAEAKRVNAAIAKAELGASLGNDLSITQLRFFPGEPYIRLPDQHPPGVRLDQLVEFAVYGKLVLRDGAVVAPTEVIDEFLDLRHVFVLPNINPAPIQPDQLDDSLRTFFEANAPQLKPLLNRPRDLFNQQQGTDVWLLEYALLRDRNLRHLACTLERDGVTSLIAVELVYLGGPRVWIDFCLRRDGYRHRDRISAVQMPGDYAWEAADPSNTRLHIRLRMNTYPCTIVGIGTLPPGPGIHDPGARAECDTLYTLAWGHDFKRGGHTIWDCARILNAVGARYALVLDEGQDVFQAFLADRKNILEFTKAEEEGRPIEPWTPVPIAFRSATPNTPRVLKRRSLRATLAFWQQR